VLQVAQGGLQPGFSMYWWVDCARVQLGQDSGDAAVVRPYAPLDAGVSRGRRQLSPSPTFPPLRRESIMACGTVGRWCTNGLCSRPQRQHAAASEDDVASLRGWFTVCRGKKLGIGRRDCPLCLPKPAMKTRKHTHLNNVEVS
jgi:hypothetical protein